MKHESVSRAACTCSTHLCTFCPTFSCTEAEAWDALQTQGEAFASREIVGVAIISNQVNRTIEPFDVHNDIHVQLPGYVWALHVAQTSSTCGHCKLAHSRPLAVQSSASGMA